MSCLLFHSILQLPWARIESITCENGQNGKWKYIKKRFALGPNQDNKIEGGEKTVTVKQKTLQLLGEFMKGLSCPTVESKDV